MNKARVAYSSKILKAEFSRFSRLIYRNFSAENNEKQTYSGEKENWNILKVFSSKKNSFLELHRYGPFQTSTERMKMWVKRTIRDAELMDQRFIEDRHAILGNDLATAHFIVFRGGKVKFIGQPDWIAKPKETKQFDTLPNKYKEGWVLEGVDASGLLLRYEGFQNLKALFELRTLILRNCPNIDDWCVDRISNEFQDTLEVLDLSGCHKVTERALSCIYRLKNLRTLVLNDIVKTRTFEYACILLEDALPDLTIEGVKYLEVPEVLENT